MAGRGDIGYRLLFRKWTGDLPPEENEAIWTGKGWRGHSLHGLAFRRNPDFLGNFAYLRLKADRREGTCRLDGGGRGIRTSGTLSGTGVLEDHSSAVYSDVPVRRAP